MAARDYPLIQCGPRNVQVRVHGLGACSAELQEYVVIAGAGQDAGLFQVHLFDELKVVRHRPNPAGYLRVLVASLFAEFDGLSVALGIEEEFALSNQTGIAVNLVQKVIDMQYLFRRIWWSGLLAVTKCRVGYPYFFGHVVLDALIVKTDSRELLVRERFSIEVRLGHVRQFIFILCHIQLLQ